LLRFSGLPTPALRERLHGGLSAGLVTEDGAFAILPSGYRPHPWLACRAARNPHDPPNNFRVLADDIIIIRPDCERPTLRRPAKKEGWDMRAGGRAKAFDTVAETLTTSRAGTKLFDI
jgi:hypothetical protein